jgi:hypothetical protein
MRKLWGSDSERRSRFHTRRGELMPMAHIVGLPLMALSRLVRPQRQPWMASGAVRWLDENLTREMALLELGSGSSTAWYGSRVGRVVSVEPDPEWRLHVSRSIEHLENVQLISESIRGAFGRLSSDSFDVVIVDHSEAAGDMSRLDALAELRSSVSIAVLDDSDRPGYAEADRLMSTWRAARYKSYRSRPLAPTETTIFTR